MSVNVIEVINGLTSSAVESSAVAKLVSQGFVAAPANIVGRIKLAVTVKLSVTVAVPFVQPVNVFT